MNERPHVVLDALLVRPEPTGVARSILELTRALSAADRGMDFSLLSSHAEMFDFLNDFPHWQVVPCPEAAGSSWRKAWYTQWQLPRIVRRLRAQILHSLQFVGPYRLSTRHVVTVHDLAFWHFPHTVEQPRRTAYRLLVPLTLRRCNRIITNSAATAREVIATFPETAQRITVTPFGTPSWVLQQTEAPVERPENAPFLFVGTLEPRKNLERLLVAYEQFLKVCQERGSVAPDLVLVGSKGWRDSRLRERISDLQQLGKLKLEGYCGPERLWHLYSSARALLFPSLHEGFGFPILEAMAANLPVLTSDRGAMKEVAGDAALLVDPTDTQNIAQGIEKLYFQEGLSQGMAEAGHHRHQAWNWQQTADMTISVYTDVLSEAK